LLFIVGHRAIVEEKFSQLTKGEQQHRLHYDSIWHYLFRTGLGFFSVTAFIWAVVELGIHQEQPEAIILLLGFDLILFILLVINWRWIAIVNLEGFRKHKTAGAIVRIGFGFLGFAYVCPALTSIIRVFWSPESKALLAIPFMTLVNLFPIGIFVVTLLGVLITVAIYGCWREESSRINTA